MSQLALMFEIVTKPHTAIHAPLQTLERLNDAQLLPAPETAAILKSKFTAPQSQYVRFLPLLDVGDSVDYMDGRGRKRLHVFCDPNEPEDMDRMVSLRSTVMTVSNIEVEMPEAITRGPCANFTMAVRAGCCSGRTLIHYGAGQSFKKLSSAGDIKSQMRAAWQGISARTIAPEELISAVRKAMTHRIA
jgi:hypothetical protein